MSTSRRASYGLLALGLMLSCLSAQAQSWPLSGPQNTTYKCRWSRLIGSTTTYGESRVTFTSLVGSNDSRSGMLHTEYRDGSVRDEAVTVNWIPYFGNNVFQLTVPATGTARPACCTPTRPARIRTAAARCASMARTCTPMACARTVPFNCARAGAPWTSSPEGRAGGPTPARRATATSTRGEVFAADLDACFGMAIEGVGHPRRITLLARFDARLTHGPGQSLAFEQAWVEAA